MGRAQEKQSKLTRRVFIRRAASAATAASLGMDLPAEEKTRVVLVRDRGAIGPSGRAVSSVIEGMLRDAVIALTGAGDERSAWIELAGDVKKAGIKTNEWAHLPTPAEVENAITKGLRLAGIKGNIPITDRKAMKMLRRCDGLVNTRPLRTHHWAGVGSSIKNYIMFVSKPWELHADMCVDLGRLLTLPILKGKTKLNVLVMLTPLFYGRGAHHFNKKYTWRYKGLIVSRDPVASDSVGLRILEARRKKYFGDERPLSHLAHHIEQADKKWGVGVADPDKIELVKIGWKEDILI